MFNSTACADFKTFWIIEVRPFWAYLWKDKGEIDRTVSSSCLLDWIGEEKLGVTLFFKCSFTTKCVVQSKKRLYVMEVDDHIEYSFSHLPVNSKNIWKGYGYRYIMTPVNGVNVPSEKRWETGFIVIKNDKQYHTCISVLSLDEFHSASRDMNANFFCPTQRSRLVAVEMDRSKCPSGINPCARSIYYLGFVTLKQCFSKAHHNCQQAWCTLSMLSWWMKNVSHSINICNTVAEVVPLYFIDQLS